MGVAVGMASGELEGVLVGGHHRIISTDLFDTVLLRDTSTESERLAAGCRRAAATLHVDPEMLVRLRWSCQELAYRAVAVEGGTGEASLAAICSVMSSAIGLGADAAAHLREAEISVDLEHLRPNRAMVRILATAADARKRVIAVSDTYYAESDLRRLLDSVVGSSVISAVYSSSDIGYTKHAGGLYDEVASREGMAGEKILHVGDNWAVDVLKARAAGWQAVHLDRGRGRRVAKLMGKVRAVPEHVRRVR